MQYKWTAFDNSIARAVQLVQPELEHTLEY